MSVWSVVADPFVFEVTVLLVVPLALSRRRCRERALTPRAQIGLCFGAAGLACIQAAFAFLLFAIAGSSGFEPNASPRPADLQRVFDQAQLTWAARMGYALLAAVGLLIRGVSLVRGQSQPAASRASGHSE